MKTPLLPALLLLSPCIAAAEAPLSLTASDGSGLKLLKLQASVVVQDPLAFTELHLTFQNLLDRVLEGQFKIVLPTGAAVSRFAMKLDDRWQEGEVVERQAARRAYEDFLHRRQDPALLEQGGANEFTARVFPIPAQGTKEIIVSWSHELIQAGAPYVLPLKGLPEIGELEVSVTGVNGETGLRRRGFTPSADFSAVPVRHDAGLRSGDLVVARVVPLQDAALDPLGSLTLLVDSSGSRALGWRRQVELVRQLVAELARKNPKGKLAVAAFDQAVQPIYSGTLDGFGEGAAAALRQREALGASSLQAALEHVAAHPTSRVVLLTDGVATAGATEGPELAARVKALRPAGVERIDAIAVGGIRDQAALARIAVGNLPRDGVVLDGALPAGELARRLGLASGSKLAVKVEGASQAWPSAIDGVQPGDAALIYAKLPASAALRIAVGGRTVASGDGGVASVERPLLERAWAKARLAALQEQIERSDDDKRRAALKAEAVSLSVRSRVLSPYTALLVLETENDYARFQIDRRALADVLTIIDGRLAVQHRAMDSLVLQQAAHAHEPDPPPASGGQDGAEGGAPGAAAAPADSPAGPAPQDDYLEEVVVTGARMPRAELTTAAPVTAVPGSPAATAAREAELEQEQRQERQEERRREEPWNAESDPYSGKFKEVMVALGKDKARALEVARGWHQEQPGDLLALIALGEALEANGDAGRAARAYGSIIDLFPARADLRRFAGVRLERISSALALSVDTFAKAAQQRPDHPQSHRLLAYALLRTGDPEKAFAAIVTGMQQHFPSGRFAGIERILAEDLGLIAAAWIKAKPPRADEILGKLRAAGGTVEDAPSLRFILNWETDANDVDFHITDGAGGHAYYQSKTLASGGELYADVTTGYGPECFTIRAPRKARSYPYRLQAHYYSIGPMGAGMGKLEIIEHDGRGGLRFEERPYVVMQNQAYVDLGVVNQ